MIFNLLTKRYPGFRAWLVQRLTALIMAFFSVIVLLKLCILMPTDFASWQAFFAPVWFRALCVLFWLCLSVHAWLGVRDVLKDYVPNIAVQLALARLFFALIWLYLAWSIWLFSTV